jgi:hypothetical protein
MKGGFCLSFGFCCRCLAWSDDDPDTACNANPFSGAD